jgi:glyoxylase-like metal-dependent hydrolase (beta-lactamase superfamily II)
MVRLHLIVDGTFTADRRLFLPEGPSSSYVAAAKCLLIETEKEKILVDTGIGALPGDGRFDAVRRNQRVERKKGQGVERGLARLGIRPGQVTTVVNTHLHNAHCGNNNLFANAQFYVARSELRFVQRTIDDDPAQTAYVVENYDRVRSVNETRGERRITEEVSVVPTPGHTEGHQSVVVSLGDRNLVYSGDVAPLRQNLEERVAMAGCDRRQAVESMDRLLKIPNARWVFSHDRSQLTLSKAFAPR